MRILIADDHVLFRSGLRSLFEANGDEVVGEAGNGLEAIELAEELEPDIVLMDLSMPEMGGIEATRQLSEKRPEIRIVILTASVDDESLFEAIKAGAQGFVHKDLEAEELFALLEGAQRGEPALTPKLAGRVLSEFARVEKRADDPDHLTEREREVLQLMVDGFTSNRKLARKLELSENTVKFHVRNILDKLRLHSRAEAVGYAVREKILDP